MDIEKEREAFEAWYCKNHTGLKQSDLAKFRTLSDYSFSDSLKINISWEAWQAAKAQAVLEKDQQVWATSNLTWKDIAFRALSCKVLKSTENWVHVKNIACVGSTTASLICKKLGVDPDGTKFELIEPQEPTND